MGGLLKDVRCISFGSVLNCKQNPVFYQVKGSYQFSGLLTDAIASDIFFAMCARFTKDKCQWHAQNCHLHTSANRRKECCTYQVMSTITSKPSLVYSLDSCLYCKLIFFIQLGYSNTNMRDSMYVFNDLTLYVFSFQETKRGWVCKGIMLQGCIPGSKLSENWVC